MIISLSSVLAGNAIVSFCGLILTWVVWNKVKRNEKKEETFFKNANALLETTKDFEIDSGLFATPLATTSNLWLSYPNFKYEKFCELRDWLVNEGYLIYQNGFYKMGRYSGNR